MTGRLAYMTTRGRSARAGVCLVACLLGAAVVAGGTKGKVKNHVYYSPENNFNVPVGRGMFGAMKIDDSYDKSGVGAVSFHDDFGSNTGIHYMRIPPEALAKFDAAAHPDQLLSDWLNNAAMPGWFRHASPDSKVLHETAANFENMEVLLAEVEIPGGSAMVVMDKGGNRRLDSRRGLIIFRRGKYIYMLTDEQQTVIGSMNSKREKTPKEEAPKDWATFADGMKYFYKSITFTD
jgi:hypothetical protein